MQRHSGASSDTYRPQQAHTVALEATSEFLPLRKRLRRKSTGQEHNFVRGWGQESVQVASMTEEEVELLRLDHHIEVRGLRRARRASMLQLTLRGSGGGRALPEAHSCLFRCCIASKSARSAARERHPSARAPVRTQCASYSLSTLAVTHAISNAGCSLHHGWA